MMHLVSIWFDCKKNPLYAFLDKLKNKASMQPMLFIKMRAYHTGTLFRELQLAFPCQ